MSFQTRSESWTDPTLAMTLRYALPLITLLAMPGLLLAQPTYPPRPAQNESLADQCALLTPDDAAAVRSTCATLLAEKKIPIIVVSIPSLATYGASGWTIDRYAYNLFDEWGVGFRDYNYGILLLVSLNDRHARIELGRDWGRDHDEVCRQIIDDLIIPRFKHNDYSGGIRIGVEALDKMARGQEIPHSTIAQRTGRSLDALWAWLGRNIKYALIIPIIILNAIFRGNRSSGWLSGGDGDGGGGSFGGGSSGGGGASGSW